MFIVGAEPNQTDNDTRADAGNGGNVGSFLNAAGDGYFTVGSATFRGTIESQQAPTDGLGPPSAGPDPEDNVRITVGSFTTQVNYALEIDLNDLEPTRAFSEAGHGGSTIIFNLEMTGAITDEYQVIYQVGADAAALERIDVSLAQFDLLDPQTEAFFGPIRASDWDFVIDNTHLESLNSAFETANEALNTLTTGQYFGSNPDQLISRVATDLNSARSEAQALVGTAFPHPLIAAYQTELLDYIDAVEALSVAWFTPKLLINGDMVDVDNPGDFSIGQALEIEIDDQAVAGTQVFVNVTGYQTNTIDDNGMLRTSSEDVSYGFGIEHQSSNLPDIGGTTPPPVTPPEVTPPPTAQGPDFVAQNFESSRTVVNVNRLNSELFDFVWEIANTGTGDDPGDVESGIYLSTDATVDLNDRQIHEEGFRTLEAGDVDTNEFEDGVALPSNLSAGLYWIGVVADNNEDVTELSEDNNTSNVIEIVVGNYNSSVASGAADFVDRASATVNQRILAQAGNDIVVTGAGADYIDGGTGADTMSGGRGNDFYIVDNPGDTVFGEENYSLGGGIDTVRSFIDYAQPNNIELVRLGNIEDTAPLSATGNDAPGTLVGNAGANTLTGRGGNDQINGNDGDDVLIGNSGRDTLVGGAGADRFIYSHLSETRTGIDNRDVINGFDRGADRIDLSLMDANLGGAGEGQFRFIGFQQFSGTAGELRLQGLGGPNAVLIEGDSRGDGVADFQIFVNVVTELGAGDFIL